MLVVYDAGGGWADTPTGVSEPARANLAASPASFSISTRSLPQVNSIDAVRIANDTVYGLAAYIQSKDIEHARSIASRMRA